MQRQITSLRGFYSNLIFPKQLQFLQNVPNKKANIRVRAPAKMAVELHFWKCLFLLFWIWLFLSQNKKKQTFSLKKFVVTVIVLLFQLIIIIEKAKTSLRGKSEKNVNYYPDYFSLSLISFICAPHHPTRAHYDPVANYCMCYYFAFNFPFKCTNYVEINIIKQIRVLKNNVAQDLKNINSTFHDN